MKFVIYTFFFIGILFLGRKVYAQHNAVAAGGDASGSGGSVSYSIGQIDYISATGANGKINQGLQQPYEFFIIGIDKYPAIELEAIVYPNPTTDAVQLVIKNKNLKNLSYQLLDMRGRILIGQQINSNKTQIDMHGLAAATYFLSVYDAKNILKTFKIIKHNTY